MSKVLDFTCLNCNPSEALVRLSQESNSNIIFNPDLLNSCESKNYEYKEVVFENLLKQIIACKRLSYKVSDHDIVLFKKQGKYNLSGYIQDAETGERLIGATISFIGEKGLGAITNEFGFFSIRLEEGDYTISIMRIGYKPEIREVELLEDRLFTFKIRPNAVLPEITVRPVSEDSSTETSNVPKNILTTNLLQSLPTPGGEPDLLRQVGFESGVQTGVDGIGGLHIRGGNADQNLILLDDVPVYNASHALGIFSIFNTQTINQARLWKGDFPARYGGRISSVLDIRTRDGNMRRWQGNAGVGLFAGSASLEGPIKKDKGSILIGYRDTYFQPWTRFLKNENENLISFLDNKVEYRFFDINLKANYILSPNDRIYLTLYRGGDRFKNSYTQNYSSTEGYVTDKNSLGSKWGNDIAALRWNHVFKGNLFSNTTLRYSQFLFQSALGFNSVFFPSKGREITIFDFGQFYQTLIKDLSFKSDFTWYAMRNLTARWGGAYTKHQFRPGALSINYLIPGQSQEQADSIANVLLNNQTLTAGESEAYVDAEWRPGKYWRIEGGLNGARFAVDNTVHYALLPRIKTMYMGPKGWRQWIGFHQSAQFLHQIGAFNVSLPFELWVPSTANVRPERAWQFSTGIGFEKNGWRIQSEFYYKKMERVLYFISLNDAISSGGAIDANGWEDRIIEGVGYSRGLEFSVERYIGAFNCSATYVNAKSTRQFEDFNSGRPFPFRFDRRHDFKLVANQRFTKRFSMTASWSFATGNPITLAGVKITHQSASNNVEREVYLYSAVNGYRLPNFHRLDFGLNAQFGRKRLQHFIQIGAYNVYNRANPFYLYLDTASGVTGRAIQYTLLPLLPVLRYEVHY